MTSMLNFSHSIKNSSSNCCARWWLVIGRDLRVREDLFEAKFPDHESTKRQYLPAKSCNRSDQRCCQYLKVSVHSNFSMPKLVKREFPRYLTVH